MVLHFEQVYAILFSIKNQVFLSENLLSELSLCKLYEKWGMLYDN